MLMTSYLSPRGWGRGEGDGGRGYKWRVSLLHAWIYAFETIYIQFPQDIQLHMKNCCMRKNSSYKRYTRTGVWLITQQTTNKETNKRPSVQREDRKNTKYCDIEIETEKFWGKVPGKLLWNDKMSFRMILLRSLIAKMLGKKLQLSERVKPLKKTSLSISINLTRKVYHQPLTISNRPRFLLSCVQTLKGDHWQTYSRSVGKHCSYRADGATWTKARWEESNREGT